MVLAVALVQPSCSKKVPKRSCTGCRQRRNGMKTFFSTASFWLLGNGLLYHSCGINDQMSSILKVGKMSFAISLTLFPFGPNAILWNTVVLIIVLFPENPFAGLSPRAIFREATNARPADHGADLRKSQALTLTERVRNQRDHQKSKKRR